MGFKKLLKNSQPIFFLFKTKILSEKLLALSNMFCFMKNGFFHFFKKKVFTKDYF